MVSGGLSGVKFTLGQVRGPGWGLSWYRGLIYGEIHARFFQDYN